MKRITSVLRSPAFWVIAVAFGVAIAANWQSNLNHGSNIRADEPAKSGEDARKTNLLREGTQVDDLRGRFIQSGDRTVFVEEGTNRTTKCLENLWLQRIVSAQKTDRKVTWQISGKVTEFEGENFLILEVATKNR